MAAGNQFAVALALHENTYVSMTQCDFYPVPSKNHQFAVALALHENTYVSMTQCDFYPVPSKNLFIIACEGD